MLVSGSVGMGIFLGTTLLLVVGRLRLGPGAYPFPMQKIMPTFAEFLESSTPEGPEVHVVEDALDSERRMDVHRASFAFDVPWFW